MGNTINLVGEGRHGNTIYGTAAVIANMFHKNDELRARIAQEMDEARETANRIIRENGYASFDEE